MTTSHPLYKKLIKIYAKASRVENPIDMMSPTELDLWKEMILNEDDDFQKILTTQFIAIRKVRQRLGEVMEDTNLHQNTSRTLSTFLSLAILLETQSHTVHTDGTPKKMYESLEKDTKILWQLLQPHRLEWEENSSEIYEIFKEGYDLIIKHYTYYISFYFNSDFPLDNKYREIIIEICNEVLDNKFYPLNLENHSFAKIILQYLQESGLWGFCSGTTKDALISSKKSYYLIQLIDEYSSKNPSSLIKEHDYFLHQGNLIKKQSTFLELDIVVQSVNHKWNQSIRNFNPGRGSAIKSIGYFVRLLEEIKKNIEANRMIFLNRLSEHSSFIGDSKTATKSDKVNIVSIYAKEDKRDYYDKFILQCHFLKEKANFWNEDTVTPGDSKILEMENAVKNADIILLFISSDLDQSAPHNIFRRFLKIIKSDLSEKIDSKECRIIPIPLRPWAGWNKIRLTNKSTLGSFHPIPNPPVIFDDTNKDKIFAEIAEKLDGIVENIQKQ